MRRVMIVGQPGAGKSTLARALHAKTGLPLVHLDQVHWMAGWQERDPGEKARIMAEKEAGDSWIIEGGFSTSWPNRIARCDTFIWIDVSLGLRLWRVLRRTWRHWGQARPDLPEGCPERFGPETLEFWWYILRTSRRARRKLWQTCERARAQGKTVYHLHNLAETARFLDEFGTEDGAL